MNLFKRSIYFFLGIVLSYSPLFSLEKEDTVIFYHIPKTAGLSISYLLTQQFDAHRVCPEIWYFQIENQSINYLKQFKLFIGHFFFNSILKELENTKKIVFLRDPVQRVLSEQRYYQYHPENRDAWIYKPHFLPEGEPIYTVSNQQCLFLSSLDRNDLTITPEQHLVSAKQNLLEEFYFVGITEQLEKSLQTLYSLMEWQLPVIIPHKNFTNITLENIDDQLLEEIKQRNLLDIELYEFALHLFNSRNHVF